MLDAISDFWKPSKKTDTEAPLDISALKVGSSIGFGFIPQTALTGKRATIHAINTYEFAGDRLTSYVLDVAGDTSISLIIANGEGEKYIALSRRIPLSERGNIFDNNELLAVLDQSDHKRLQAKSQTGEWEEWVVDSYKKAIHGLSGKLMPGDFRSFSALPENTETKEFTYSLLVSNNNEYAIELEQYSDNRLEVYATVYRRLSDIGEIKAAAPEMSVVEAAPKAKPIATTARELSELKPANDTAELKKPEGKSAPALKAPPSISLAEPAKAEVAEKTESPVVQAEDAKSFVLKPLTPTAELPIPAKYEPHLEMHGLSTPVPDFAPVKAVVPTIQTLEQAPASLPKIQPQEEKAKVEKTPEPKVANIAKRIEPISQPEPANQAPENASPEVDQKTEGNQEENAELNKASTETATTETSTKENSMATFNAFNGKADNISSDIRTARAIPGQQTEVENDSVECELRAANRIIEEAIRNEMRMSDVVRRIIALPVAQQEQVEIPVMLTDSDYHLLAIRYGIPAADRSAIKAKIIEEINDFSGSNR